MLINHVWVNQLNATSENPLSASAGFVNTNLINYQDVIRLGNTVTSIWKSYVPIPPLFQVNFWNRNILTDNVFHGWLFRWVTRRIDCNYFIHCIVFSISIFLFRRPNVLRTYIFGTLIIFLFQFFIHTNSILRHDGYFFIVLILCAWLYMESNFLDDENRNLLSSSRKRHPLFSLFLSTLLSVQAFAGIHAMGIDYLYSFSSGKTAAEFIRINSLTDFLIAGDHYAYTAVISGYLDMPIYYLDSQKLGTFWTKTPRKFVDNADLFQAIEAKAEANKIHKMVLVLTQPLAVSDFVNATNMQFKQLAEFEQSIVRQEKFYLYFAEKDV